MARRARRPRRQQEIRDEQGQHQMLPLSEVHSSQGKEHEGDRHYEHATEPQVVTQKAAKQAGREPQRPQQDGRETDPVDEDLREAQRSGDPHHGHVQGDHERRVDLDDIHVQACSIEHASPGIEEKCDVRLGVAAELRQHGGAHQEREGQDEHRSALQERARGGRLYHRIRTRSSGLLSRPQ